MSKVISIYVGTSPVFSVHEVIERVVLNFVSLQVNVKIQEERLLIREKCPIGITHQFLLAGLA